MGSEPQPASAKPIPNRRFRPFAQLDGLDLRTRVIHFRNLYKATFRESLLSGSVLSGCTARRMVLDGAQMIGATIERTHMEDSSLRGVVARHMVVSRSRLTRCDFTGASLSFAHFVAQADLTQEIFDGATLTEAHLRNAPGASFVGAIARGTHFNDGVFTDANFTDAKLINADFTGADLTGADITGADLTGAKVTVAQILTTVGWQKAAFGSEAGSLFASVQRRSPNGLSREFGPRP
jgi:uncharacterized protein YjbI with pentapeptide repeats